MVRASWSLPLAALILAAVPRAQADELPLFRLFLRDGTTVACLGEYARVGARVVVTVPITADAADAQLVSIEANRVDWARTERYAESLRRARYAETRGETDFAILSGEVARVLNEIAFTTDPARRLVLARQARTRLADWPREHYDYRAEDVRQILQLVDEAISGIRASAGEQAFDLALVATVTPPSWEPLLPAPTAEQALAGALAVAERLDNAAERMSLLAALDRVAARDASDMPPPVAIRLRDTIASRLEAEREVEADYARLVTRATTRARTGAAAADVRTIQAVIASVQQKDAELGRQRPRRVSSLLLALQEQLDSARRLRLARDRYALRVKTYRAYRGTITASLERLDALAAGLDDIKRLAGPAAAELERLARRALRAVRELAAVVPPPELAPAHALFLSAAQMASQAVAARRDAVRTGEMDRAWGASSAAAGSLMLLARGRADLQQALTPPALP